MKITFNTALMLGTLDKNDWFNCEPNEFYNKTGNISTDNLEYAENLYPAPEQSVVQEYLRASGVFVMVGLDATSYPKFNWEIYTRIDLDWQMQSSKSLYRTYEEALEEGLQNGIQKL